MRRGSGATRPRRSEGRGPARWRFALDRGPDRPRPHARRPAWGGCRLTTLPAITPWGGEGIRRNACSDLEFGDLPLGRTDANPRPHRAAAANKVDFPRKQLGSSALSGRTAIGTPTGPV